MNSGRAQTIAMALGGVVVGAVAVVVVRGPLAADPGTSTSPTPAAAHVSSVSEVAVAAALDYLEAVKPLAQEGGRVVQQGMKPAVTQLQDPDGDHAQQARVAPSWVETMRDLRHRWGEVGAPDELAGANAQFLEAWDLYIRAAEALGDAAVDETRREALVREAVTFGERGDEAWNEAAAIAQSLLVAAGEDPMTWLPSPRSDE